MYDDDLFAGFWVWFFGGLLLILATGFACGYCVSKVESAVPPRPEQPHADIFTAAGITDMQALNPVSRTAKATRTATYRLVTASGCSTGTIPGDLDALAADAAKNLKFSLVRNDAAFDFTVYINCGNEQIRQCGSVNIFCLPYGFPYNVDVSLSDILNTYPAVTRRSILNHEILGHAISTWNEQYCVGYETTGVCAGQPQFTSTPNWEDVMNTGPLSRHDIGLIEIERWDRTMYPLIVECVRPGYDPCTGRWFQPDGWSWDPVAATWIDQQNRQRFGPCNADKLRLDLLDMHWWRIPSQNLGFDYSLNQFVVVPAC